MTGPGRRHADVGELLLESGTTLPGARIAYETWGNPQAGNAVLICHALTGDAHVVGPAGPGQPTPGWWDGLIGPGRYLDPRDWHIVAANVLGGCQGSTGPSSQAPDGRPWGSRFPAITIRDQVTAEAALADALGIDRWAAVIGGSMGGMRAIEWPLMFPDRVGTAIVLASTGYASADQIAWCAPQLAAITADPDWQGGDYYGSGRAPIAGLGIARRIAHVTYRSSYELAARFGRSPQTGENPATGGRYAVESYLDHHAAKLAGRFDPGSYVVLTRAMNSHDITRGRGDLAAALAGLKARLVVAAVDSDRLYPPSLSAELVAACPDADGVHTIASPYGHDGFLIELDQVGALVARTLGRVAHTAGH
ncbi:homoserine O-acetyltransferase [Kribbella sandramycini]|uniref:Homoserine O-acetyltransferase n=1 Tax=Kribbella sandramycini TaxID=60450 RepID=A0A7Y4NZB6_9ACTN|nr:homoserine O-acetyltransferase [Kribbella sandramycini]MBB6567567.1 homoserine O-acetyltransferase [Kribbella sandramycini]NOL39829.1 homoserine O-acetyltransferase [Kribbella sandramycini]